jgi:hypothetical protein
VFHAFTYLAAHFSGSSSQDVARAQSKIIMTNRDIQRFD